MQIHCVVTYQRHQCNPSPTNNVLHPFTADERWVALFAARLVYRPFGTQYKLKMQNNCIT